MPFFSICRPQEREGPRASLVSASNEQCVDYRHDYRHGSGVGSTERRRLDRGNEALSRNIPIGGTSAGLAVLGEFVYSAQGDLPDGPDLSSPEVLSNPFNPRVTIVHQFLDIPLLKEVITDTHFSARDRLGRTLVFMARILQDGSARRIRDIAVDQGAGALLNPDGTATVVGDGSAYFLEATRKPEICKANTPLTFREIAVRSLRSNEQFNVRHWSSDQGLAYILSVESGVIHSTLPGGAVYTNQK